MFSGFQPVTSDASYWMPYPFICQQQGESVDLKVHINKDVVHYILKTAWNSDDALAKRWERCVFGNKVQKRSMLEI